MYLYYDPAPAQQATQTGKIYLYYTPDQAYTLEIESHKPFTKFTSIFDTMTLEDHYIEALVYNLTVRIFRKFHQDTNTQIPVDIARIARDSLLVIQQNNAAQYPMTCDTPSATGRIYNIRTDSGY